MIKRILTLGVVCFLAACTSENNTDAGSSTSSSASNSLVSFSAQDVDKMTTEEANAKLEELRSKYEEVAEAKGGDTYEMYNACYTKLSMDRMPKDSDGKVLLLEVEESDFSKRMLKFFIEHDTVEKVIDYMK